MNFTDLCQEVYTLTNRPDLVAETAAAVRAATLRCHHVDFFPKDLVERYYGFATEEYYQQLATPTLPKFRALKYIRKYYPGTTLNNPPVGLLPPLFPGLYSPGANLPDGRFFTVITPGEVLDSYQINRVDVAYLAGQIIQIKSADQFSYCLVGYYKNPDLIPATYDSWIAVEHPYAIIFDATAVVFKTIGYDEQYTAYNDLKAMEFSQLQMSNVLAEGY